MRLFVKEKMETWFRLWSLKKRAILICFLVLLSLVLSKTSQGTMVSPVGGAQTTKRNEVLMKAQEKIKDGSGWKPKGYGSGEYLQDIPKIKAGAVVDLDNGDVVWSLNLKQRIAPASLTKVATAITALDVENVQKSLVVSDGAAEQIPTKLGLRIGESLKLEEAISGAILTSANDAAETISDSIGKELGGGTDTFMQLVNKKLEKMGANSSHFVTSTGLDDPDHYSTVYDLAIIAHEALSNYPLISELASQSYKRLEPGKNHALYDLPNWNALLGTYPGVNGLKIGYTENSGHSTMVTANRDGKKLVAIVIGAKGLEEREIAAATLLNYGFEKKGLDAYPIANLDLTTRFEDWRRQLTYGGP